MIEVTMRFAARVDSRCTAPLGMATPDVMQVGFAVEGADMTTVCAGNVAQRLALEQPMSNEIVLP